MESIAERLLGIAGGQHGYVTPRDAEDLNIDPVELRKLAARGRLDHVAHGVYRFPTFPYDGHDDLVEATLWAGGRGVISHESALALWDLCDVNPRRVHITIPVDYNLRRKGGEKVRVWHRALAADEMDEIEGIRVVVPERAIADGIEMGLDHRLIDQSIRNARSRGLVGPKGAQRLRQLARNRGKLART